MLTLTNLTASIKKKELFHLDSFSFEPEKIHYIAGENGRGKTSLLQIIRGNTKAFSFLSGELHYNHKTYHLAQSDRPSTGYVIQQYRQILIPTFTVEQNIATAQIHYYPRLSSCAQTNDLTEQLNHFSIKSTDVVEQLSGGQQQILAILLILSHHVDILLLDEPTAALDIENRNLVINFLSELVQSKKCYVIMVTHDQELLQSTSILQQVHYL
jgi:putative ABC transport system ATP-binding protein